MHLTIVKTCCCVMFSCPNPSCPRLSNSTFNTQRGLTQHLRLSPICMEIECQRNVHNTKRARISAADPTDNIRQLHRTEDNRLNPKYPFVQLEDEFDMVAEDEAYWSNDDQELANEEVPQQISVIPDDDDAIVNFTNEQRHMCNLITLLDQLQAPDYAVKKVVQWAAKAYEDGWNFQPKSMERRNNIDAFYTLIDKAEEFLPAVETVTCNVGDPFECIVFDFVPQVLSLIQNKDIMLPDNLVIDMANVCGRYVSPDGRLGECHSGSVYQAMYDRLVKDPSKDFLCPVIVYGDRSQVDQHSRFSLEPFTFSLSIFTEKFRRKAEAWRPLGYIHDLKTSTAHKRSRYGPGDTVRIHHMQLRKLFETLATASERLKNIWIPSANGLVCVDVICPLLFIIADNEEADKLSGRYGSHQKGIQRRCRSCNVPNTELANPEFVCQRHPWAVLDAVAKSDNPDLHKEYSQHRLDSVFNYVPLSDPVYGINSMMPPDALHNVRLGVAKRFVKVLCKNLTDKQKSSLDDIAVRFHRSHRQSHRKTFPNTDFSRGITNLTELTAGEYIGAIFVFVIISHFTDGWDVLENAIRHQESATTVQDIVELLEAFLCFDAWLKRDKWWLLGNSDNAAANAQESIKELIRMLTTRLERKDGDGWNLLKTHLLLHFVDDAKRFGVPNNFNTEHPEHNHLYHVKRPGRRAHKVHASFERSTAQRVSDTFILKTLHQHMNTQSESSADNTVDTLTDIEDSQEDGVALGTIAHVVREPGTNNFEVQWVTKASTINLQLPKGLATFLCNHYQQDHVTIRSEYRRGTIYCRCHPNFRSTGKYYDWVRVLHNRGRHKPCRVLAVVPGAPNGFEGCDLVVQCATQRLNVQSTLFTEWNVSARYEVVDADTVSGNCFVLNLDGKNERIAECLEYDQWADQFTTTE